MDKPYPPPCSWKDLTWADIHRYPLTKREPLRMITPQWLHMHQAQTMSPLIARKDERWRKSHIDSGSPDNGESGCRELGIFYSSTSRSAFFRALCEICERFSSSCSKDRSECECWKYFHVQKQQRSLECFALSLELTAMLRWLLSDEQTFIYKDTLLYTF